MDTGTERRVGHVETGRAGRSDILDDREGAGGGNPEKPRLDDFEDLGGRAAANLKKNHAGSQQLHRS
ncbi:MAG: hypothetical protein Q7R41_00790 [Phycisphaerales bacterium]|nr:hypothetical protein [Phycisphaerales bacterium]